MKLRIFVNTFIALVGAVSVATAAPITGVINLTGSVSATSNTLDFRPPEGPGDPTETGFGLTTPELPVSGYFADMFNVIDLIPPTEVIIHTLNTRDVTLVGGGAAPLPAPVSLGATFLGDFLSGYQLFEAPLGSYTGYDYSGLFFDLTEIVDPSTVVAAQCNGTETAGDVCYLGPFVVVVGDEGVGILMEVRGFFEDPNFSVDSRSFYRGRYTTQLGLTTAQILAILGGALDPNCGALSTDNPGGGPGQICASYSANFEPFFNPIPEPASLLLFGAGAAALGAHRRRKAAKARANAAV